MGFEGKCGRVVGGINVQVSGLGLGLGLEILWLVLNVNMEIDFNLVIKGKLIVIYEQRSGVNVAVRQYEYISDGVVTWIGDERRQDRMLM